MNIFLDFDRTLFDTEGFYQLAEEYGGILATYVHPDSCVRLPSLLYNDVVSVLEQFRSEHTLYIVSFEDVQYGVPGLQPWKVECSGVSALVDGCSYTNDNHKAPLIAEYADGPFVFVDDVESHLQEVDAAFPEAHCLRMKRPGAKGSDLPTRFPVVANLHQVLGYIHEITDQSLEN